MLETLLSILHVMACLFLILVVLLQTGRGAGIGASFGGATQTFFGGRGATSFLEKLTAVSALVFVLTSMTLAYQSTRTERGLAHQAARAQRREKARQLPTQAG